MERDDIKRWQAAKISKSLQPSLGYLFRLRERMEKVGFLPSDPYFQLVSVAYNSMHALWVQTHYLSCTGVGRPSKDEAEEVGGD
jgi:hypothetical protein